MLTGIIMSSSMYCVTVSAILVSVLLKLSEQACYDYVYEQQKIAPPSYSNRKHFGGSLVLSKGYLIIGSKYDSEDGFNAGAAHVYSNFVKEWKYETKLKFSAGRAYGECGSTLAANRNTLLIGCPRDSSSGVNSGCVYVFELVNSTWLETQILKPSDARANSFFGTAIAIHKDTVIVSSSDGTLAYIFEYKSGKWQESQKLQGVGKAESVHHGHSLAVHESYLVVGHWYDSAKGHQSGSATVFQRIRGKWTIATELRASDGTRADWFGMSVAISNKFVVVSSHGDDVNGADGSGSAYVFESIRGRKWTETKKLTPRNSTSGDSFGQPVVTNGNTIAIGCTGYDSTNHNSGGVYIFQHINNTDWSEAYKCLPSDGEYNGMFGYSIALQDDTLAVGSVNHEDKTGSVYIFNLVDVTNNASLLCDPPPLPVVEEVNYALILGICIPLGVLLLVLLVFCAYKMCTKFTIERIEDNDYVYYSIVYKDAPKEEAALHH